MLGLLHASGFRPPRTWHQLYQTTCSLVSRHMSTLNMIATHQCLFLRLNHGLSVKTAQSGE